MPSLIDNTSVANFQSFPTPPSLQPGSELITSHKVGPAAVSHIGHQGYSAVESAQITAEQSYSAMAAATSGGGTDISVEYMLAKNGKA